MAGREPLAGRIVVGVDTSPGSVPALAWALRRAVADGVDVEVVTVWPPWHAVFIHQVPGHFCDAREVAERAQLRAIELASSHFDTLPAVTRRLENASVVEALLAASVDAALLVLGSRPEPRSRAAQQGPHLAVVLREEGHCAVKVV